jgi:hypothetical protein
MRTLWAFQIFRVRGKSKPAPFTIRRVRHPERLSLQRGRVDRPPHSSGSKSNISRFRSLGGTVLDLRRENSFPKDLRNYGNNEECYRRQEKGEKDTLP